MGLNATEVDIYTDLMMNDQSITEVESIQGGLSTGVAMFIDGLTYAAHQTDSIVLRTLNNVDAATARITLHGGTALNFIKLGTLPSSATKVAGYLYADETDGGAIKVA
jgi:hypothetical protein